MTQSTKTFKGHKNIPSAALIQDFRVHAYRNRSIGFLYFPLQTHFLLNSFRKQILTYIYRAALELSAGKLASAKVSLADSVDEEDSCHLDLTLVVNADWDMAQQLSQDIMDRVSEWSKEWSEENRKEYGRWIYFGVIPTYL